MRLHHNHAIQFSFYITLVALILNGCGAATTAMSETTKSQQADTITSTPASFPESSSTLQEQPSAEDANVMQTSDSDAPSIIQDTATPEIPSITQDTSAPEAPSITQDTAAPEAPSMTQDTAAPETPSTTQDTAAPETPSMTQDPSTSETPSMTQVKPTPTPKPQIIYPITSINDESRLYLTFDDGGDKKSVKRALEILEKNDVQCTFFVIGKYLRSNAALWQQAVEQGHQICNHTQNHKWLSELSVDDVKKEILEWESTATEVLGEDYVEKMKEAFPYFRLPGSSGSKSKKILGIVSELGYIPVGWSIESYYAVLRHYDLKNDPLDHIAQDVTSHVTKKAKGGSIILLHFNPYDTWKLDEIINDIKEKNLSIQLLSESGI